MTNRSTLGGGALLALALLLIGLTILFDHALRGWRVDLTANHLYTTAPGTDRILKGLKEPINLYFFYSEKPVIGWLASLPKANGFDPKTGQQREPWAIYTQAQQLFDVRPVEAASGKIDPDITLLVIVHPKNLSPAMQFAIDQYALKGGH